MTPPQDRRPARRGGNADYPWYEFDSVSYVEHNYGTPRCEDLEL
jgi:hypothetical protein